MKKTILSACCVVWLFAGCVAENNETSEHDTENSFHESHADEAASDNDSTDTDGVPTCRVSCGGNFPLCNGSLCWSERSDEELLYSDALAYCDSFGGRLPDINELRSLITNCPETVLGGSCPITPEEPEYRSDQILDNCYCHTDEAAEGKYTVFDEDATESLWSSTTASAVTPKSKWVVIFGQATLRKFGIGDFSPSLSNVRCLPGDSGDTEDTGNTGSTGDTGNSDKARATEQWGTSASDSGNSAAVDSNDNIYVTGYVSGDLDGHYNAGDRDIFLTKYSADGIKQWTKLWGTSSDDEGHSVAIDSSDNIYITGWTDGKLDGNTNAGNAEIFLTKFSADGTKQWTKLWGTYEDDHGNSVAVDSSDNIYVTGKTQGDLDGNTNVGWNDIFLTKFSADGTKQWTKLWGTSGGDIGRSAAVDSNDNIYVTGWTTGGLDGNIHEGSYDIFLTKYSADGTKQWTKLWGTSRHDVGYSIAVDSSDTIYVTGYTKGDLNGTTGTTNAGGTDIFLTRYSADGTQQWTKLWGSEEWDKGNSAAVDSSDNIYVTGWTRGVLDKTTNAGEEDVFLTKYSADGTKQWTQQWGTEEWDYGNSVATDSSDNIYVTGQTYGDLGGTTNAGNDDIFLTKWFSDALD